MLKTTLSEAEKQRIQQEMQKILKEQAERDVLRPADHPYPPLVPEYSDRRDRVTVAA